MKKKHLVERTNLRTIVVSGAIFAIGISLLLVSEWSDYVIAKTWLKAVVSNLGGLLVATVSIAILWELVSKRAFLDELLETAGLVEDIKSLGLVSISTNPLNGPNFEKLIKDSSKVDIFVCYANTWRAANEEHLRALARKPKVKVQLIVPNPDNMLLMEELNKRFNGASKEVMAEKVKVAIEDFKAIFNSTGAVKADFSVWVHDEDPVTSFYRFDNKVVVTLYKHAKGRGNVPTFVAEAGGSLHSYVEAEIEALVKGTQTHPALAKKIFPAAS